MMMMMMMIIASLKLLAAASVMLDYAPMGEVYLTQLLKQVFVLFYLFVGVSYCFIIC